MKHARRRSVPVAIALGSNLGDREAHLRMGADGLRESLEDVRLSSVYETRPAYHLDQPPFLNACAVARTDLPARRLLARLQSLEARAGRTREAPRYGPRTLDLDLLLYGEAVIDEEGLSVPHPRMRERAFVLVPLAELAADWKVPATRSDGPATVAELASVVDDSGMRKGEIEWKPGGG